MALGTEPPPPKSPMVVRVVPRQTYAGTSESSCGGAVPAITPSALIAWAWPMPRFVTPPRRFQRATTRSPVAVTPPPAIWPRSLMPTT
jgi:hypothetical protein